MNELVSSFYETCVERFKPLITFPRLSLYIALLLISSPSADKIFSRTTWTREVGAVVEDVISSLHAAPLWICITVAAAVFIIAPMISAYALRMFVRRFHVARGKRLIGNIKDLLDMPEHQIREMKQDQLNALFQRKIRGLRKTVWYKAIAELTIYSLFAAIVSLILSATPLFLFVVYALILAGIFYLVSREIFFCYLGEIKTYDVVAERLRQIAAP